MRFSLALRFARRVSSKAPPERKLDLEKRYGYERTLPEKYVRKMKYLEPHQTFENRFGAPPVQRFFNDMRCVRDSVYSEK